ncbi:MAG: helix-turn-helix transcriptional regulator [Polaromonas sp.]|uniref:AraC family transcriptional regulator n=1 Tax=Polaromonas sp. TaxID=1869339 RepID=UPI00272397DB|nr:helix-turn-helix transcriptional regulator [Polaromonas sp.]MDO9115316.1 helix-turn-helix transcriptional regulator [Polaromonas sp.]MDP1885690.1 helix-turn-helix transcriptional regulator [Polaromonas sp.]
MTRKPRLHFMPVGDTDPFTPSRERPVRVRARSMPVDSHFEPHTHAWAQLAYCASGIVQVTAGQSRHKADEVAYIVPPSRAVWIAPGAQHHITVLEAAEFRTLYIDASATPENWQGCRVIVVSALLRETIHALDNTGPHASLPPEGAHFSLGRPGGKTVPLNLPREQLLTRLVLDELLHADTQVLGVPLPNAQTGDKRLRALCEAVLRAPSERATLAEWAADIGASERTVARLFRDELGLSYQQWRQQAVLAHALPLLARGQSVSQVAAASGYASDSAFSAMFKAAMGQSPSHFQNKN